jgi:hypothetical protein
VSAAERVECDGCGCKTPLRVDGTYGSHSYTYRGIRIECERTGTRYARHMGTFAIVKRDPNVWMCQCRCDAAFLGPTYDDVEQQWSDHQAEVKAGVS